MSKPRPETALETYKAIIDDLVSETRFHGNGSRLKKSGIYSSASDKEKQNKFVDSLTPEQRGLLAEMLIDEREGAIHDVLAALEWWVTCREVVLTFRGEPLPVEFAEGMHHDFVGRCGGYDWPK